MTQQLLSTSHHFQTLSFAEAIDLLPLLLSFLVPLPLLVLFVLSSSF